MSFTSSPLIILIRNIIIIIIVVLIKILCLLIDNLRSISTICSSFPTSISSSWLKCLLITCLESSLLSSYHFYL